MGKEKKTIYQIVELLSSRELRDEGSSMHHCVASYAQSCDSGSRAIYSMIRTDQGGTARQITIDVDVASRKIGQVRRKYNDCPNGKDMNILSLWASKAKLKISSWVR